MRIYSKEQIKKLGMTDPVVRAHIDVQCYTHGVSWEQMLHSLVFSLVEQKNANLALAIALKQNQVEPDVKVLFDLAATQCTVCGKPINVGDDITVYKSQSVGQTENFFKNVAHAKCNDSLNKADLLCGKYGAKEDERLLLKTLQRLPRPYYVREIVRNIGINENRAAYICEKWEQRGWYEYGVNVLAGWLTDEGIKAK